MNELAITYTVFPDTNAKSSARHTVPWLDLVAELQAPQVHDTKGACPLLKLATFGSKRSKSGCLRSDENLERIYGVEGDYDEMVISVDQAAAKLTQCGIEAVIYTSARHAPEAPRFRVLAPLSESHDPSAREDLVAALNWALDGILADESFTASQTYYFGQVKGVEYQTKHVKGACLDEIAFLLGATYKKGGKAGSDTRNAEDADLDRQFTLLDVTPDTLADLEDALLNGLKESRAEERPQWIEIGMALYSIAQAGYPDEALALWHQFSARWPEKYDSQEADRVWDTFHPSKLTFKSIFKWAQDDGWVNPRTRAALTADTRVDRTDAGNMAVLDRHAQGNLRYVPELKRWYGWDGQRWVADPTGPASAQGFAFQVGEYYYAEAAKVREQLANESLDGGERRRIERVAQSIEAWAAQCRNKSRIDNMLGLAKCDGRFMLPFEALDRDPWLFGVENGVVDLRTGQLRAVGRDDFVTLRSPVAFDPGAKAPRWCQFIDEVTSHPNTGERPALAAYLQRALGYSLTGSTAEHKMFMAIGAGSNGKNVLLDMLQWLLPGYCETIAPEALMSSKHDSDAERPTPSMRKLAGTRMAISSESKDGQKLDVALVKRHTGGGYITARGLHENAFRFEITHKLWLMTNHKPALDNIDDAVRGRLHMIPFDMRWNRPGHPERNPALPDGDKQLPALLREDAQGVLAWLVEGALAYHREGLEPPEEVARMTRSYFAEQDPLTRWLQNYAKCPPDQGTGAQDLYTAFRDWCSTESASAGTSTAFGLRLGDLGIESRKTKTVRVYGLRRVTSFDDFLD